MSKEDIDKAVKEAEQYAAEDKKRKEAVDAKNAADQLVYTTEKTIADFGDKLETNEKSDIEAAVADLKEKLKGEDIEAINNSKSELEKKVYAVSEKIYKAAQAQQQANADAGNANADNNVYDTDYKDVDDTNK